MSLVDDYLDEIRQLQRKCDRKFDEGYWKGMKIMAEMVLKDGAGIADVAIKVANRQLEQLEDE